ncbi:2-dehydropantoate 2-reductase [Virgibacillus halophilus]|uniref:2-dehydropantoate 2-reductase n=1 Tax=Tigheibacillus halophilus TaxID=361280 RepID=A0ABU5CAE1_9BACI|nr:2-dehydropantoate 2-reductase [Virgibacillus halophilus]
MKLLFFVRRSEQAEAIQKYGIVRKNDGRQIAAGAALFSEMDKQDCLFVCVKQHQLEDVLPWIQRKNAQTPLFFIQNGMGHLEIIKKMQQPAFAGVVEHGSIVVNDYTYRHTGCGAISFASEHVHKQLLEKIVSKLSSQDFQFQIRSDMLFMLSEKLAVNAVINPLTAIFDVDNGQILHNTHLNCLAEQLCEEACNVLGLEIRVMWDRVMEVAEKTSANISSMRKDLHENRKTENDAISGYILKRAKKKCTLYRVRLACCQSHGTERGSVM